MLKLATEGGPGNKVAACAEKSNICNFRLKESVSQCLSRGSPGSCNVVCVNLSSRRWHAGRLSELLVCCCSSYFPLVVENGP